MVALKNPHVEEQNTSGVKVARPHPCAADNALTSKTDRCTRQREMKPSAMLFCEQRSQNAAGGLGVSLKLEKSKLKTKSRSKIRVILEGRHLNVDGHTTVGGAFVVSFDGNDVSVVATGGDSYVVSFQPAASKSNKRAPPRVNARVRSRGRGATNAERDRKSLPRPPRVSPARTRMDRRRASSWNPCPSRRGPRQPPPRDRSC
jgi:hypothetical protein